MPTPQMPATPLASLAPVFARWTKLQREMFSALTDDGAFWCGERTNVGLLASAAYLEGFMAMVDYSDNRTSPRGPRHGLIDLWLRNPAGDEFVGEAKYRLLWAKKPRTRVQHVEADLEDAVEEARTCRLPHETCARIALCFVVPKFFDEDEARLEPVVVTLAAVQADHREVIDFPKPLRWIEDGTPSWFPGVLLLARHVSARCA